MRLNRPTLYGYQSCNGRLPDIAVSVRIVTKLQYLNNVHYSFGNRIKRVYSTALCGALLHLLKLFPIRTLEISFYYLSIHLFTCLQNVSEIDCEVAKRRELAEAVGYTVQPAMFCVVDGEKRSYYCLSEDLRYKLPSALALLETTFNIHQAFNLEYQQSKNQSLDLHPTLYFCMV